MRAALWLLLIPSLAQAHANLTYPKPRNNLANKTGPCGGIARTATPLQLTAGQAVKVEWIETIDHPGYYQVRFSQSGDANWKTLVDKIGDRVKPAGMNLAYSYRVNLPYVQCSDCTLQLIQVMLDNPANPTYYYSCADLKMDYPISNNPSPSPAPAPPDMGAPDMQEAEPETMPVPEMPGESEPQAQPVENAAPAEMRYPGEAACSVAPRANAPRGLLFMLAMFAIRRRKRAE